MHSRLDSDPIAQLEADGLLLRVGDGHRTTKRWQAAMSRAARRLAVSGDDDDDLRVPITHALLEFYREASIEELVSIVQVLAPIEAAELDPRGYLAGVRR